MFLRTGAFFSSILSEFLKNLVALHRLFKKETGMNLKDYIIQQKMQEAQSLLCTTNLPISLIAAKVGYTNFGHFSTSYKKFYHKTPQEERSAAL